MDADVTPDPPVAPVKPVREPRRRRRVFVTAGLTASAAVIALSVQAAAQADDGAPSASYGDTSGQGGQGDPDES